MTYEEAKEKDEKRLARLKRDDYQAYCREIQRQGNAFARTMLDLDKCDNHGIPHPPDFSDPVVLAAK